MSQKRLTRTRTTYSSQWYFFVQLGELRRQETQTLNFLKEGSKKNDQWQWRTGLQKCLSTETRFLFVFQPFNINLSFQWTGELDVIQFSIQSILWDCWDRNHYCNTPHRILVYSLLLGSSFVVKSFTCLVLSKLNQLISWKIKRWNIILIVNSRYL